MLGKRVSQERVIAEPKPIPTYEFSSRIFQRGLGLVFLIAFLSWAVQADALVGRAGIWPFSRMFPVLRQSLGAKAWRLMPSLLWIHPTDGFLHAILWAGSAISLLPLLGFFPGPSFLALWALYLSIATGGGDFMNFQWDALLIESGFLAAFLAPWKPRLGRPGEGGPPRMALWLFWWLLFRLMIESGIVKLASGDPTWRHLTALDYHYETQPLPTWIGWYAAQLPEWFQKISAGGVFTVELALPWLLFWPGWPRRTAAAAIIGLQILIALTGNYCFFNLLTILLALLCVDDQLWKKLRLLPRTFAAAEAVPDPKRLEDWGRWRRGVGARSAKEGAFAAFALMIFVLGAVQLVEIAFERTIPYFSIVQPLLDDAQPWRTVNHYGLFAVMTTVRREIEIEGSRDGKDWKAYAFKWKPDDVMKRPGFVEPYQPRLDWQMWFAALGPWRRSPWFLGFMGKILEGNHDVLALLAGDPFPVAPPKYLRALIYEYHFTDLSQRRATGAWWTRRLLGLYCPVLSLSKQAADGRADPPPR